MAQQAAVDRPAVTAALQHLLDSLLAADTTNPGLTLHVEAPRFGLSWSGAVGTADRATGAPLTPTVGVRMASNTKTYVAAGVLRMWEAGRIALDRPIKSYLSTAAVNELVKGGYDPAAITVRHLLTHTSGIFDWGDAPGYSARVLADPTHRWSREEQLRLAMEQGKPYGPPGAVFRYSDTNYNLLGEMLERLTGKPWAPALRESVGFARLGLKATWLESLEPMALGVTARAHQYLGAMDVYDIDPSIDLWGGGGLVATMKDMALFTRGLFTGKVFRRTTTADTMLTTVPAAEGPAYRGGGSRIAKQGNYRMGISVVDYEGVVTYIHSGYWGTFSLYVPGWDLSIAGGQLQQQSPAMGRLISESIATLKRHLPPPSR